MATIGSNPVPRGQPPEGREYYLLEKYYLFDSKEVLLAVAIRVTAECVAQWCDRFDIRAVSRSTRLGEPAMTFPRREGHLPAIESERPRAVRDIVDWLEQTRGPDGLDLNLFSGTEPILFLNDSSHFLCLTPAQFGATQDCWQRLGLPRDLFYPASQQQQTIEPVKVFGGVIRMFHYYSPRQWSARASEPEVPLSVPNDEERRNAFREACQRLRNAISLRRWELGEPSNTTPAEEFKRLSVLAQAIQDYLDFAEGPPDGEPL